MPLLGHGSFKRMKSAMEGHVDTERNTMYQDSCAGVQEMLKRLISTVREQMENAADEIYFAIHRDYRLALGGGDLKPGEVMVKSLIYPMLFNILMSLIAKVAERYASSCLELNR